MRLFKTILAVALVSLTFACSSRRVETKISKKVTKSDSAGTSSRELTKADSTRKTITSSARIDEETFSVTTIYPAAGETVTVAADGSFTGKADSAKTKTSAKKKTATRQHEETSSGQKSQEINSSKSNTSHSSTENNKDKTTDREGAAPFVIASSIIIGLLIVVLIGRWLIKKYLLIIVALISIGSLAGCTHYMPDGRAYQLNCYCVASHQYTTLYYDGQLKMWLPYTQTVCDRYQTDTVWRPDKNRPGVNQH